ncbi:MAG TPA: menaquinone biosynthesis protein [Spirochaetota bacterium]|nr:menaquinone biosynthesis protein [Spirochaetota bacterium]HPS87845.1 menaquinone biosynthesis protein [Spirochaetota bacterium]
MKIGYIDYLNCYPFYHHMFHKEPLDNTIVPRYPGELNMLMKEGRLDMSPISAGAYPEMQESIILLPDFCLSSIGYVRSVVLQSKLPIEDLDGKKIGLTSASKTSMVLLKILLGKYYHLKPDYIPCAPNPDMENLDAALVIGNEAMVEVERPMPYIYDLGDLWLRKTGYPVVFAVIAVQKKTAAESIDKVQEVSESFRLSLNDLRDNRRDIVKFAGEKYPHITYDIDHYYNLLKFDFTDDLKAALQFYFSEAASLGLLDEVKKIEFIGMNK